MRTAFATFAYPAPSIERYAGECFASIVAQSDRDFTLVVFNDGLATLDDVIRKSGAVVEVLPVSGRPAAIRVDAIKRLTAQGFDLVVFGDIDDWFEPNRVEIAKQVLASGADIVVNELIAFDDRAPPRPVFGNRLHEGETLTLDRIRQGNCFGMSNTALRLSAVSSRALAADDVVAFDWLFYSRLLRDGARARYTAATCTHYRRHANNAAPLDSLGDADIRRGLDIKYRHYQALGDSYCEAFATTLHRLATDTALAARYYAAVRAALPRQTFWWEAMKPVEEIGL